jgi:hypothetical protein
VSLGTTWIARLERGFTTLLPEGVAAKMDPSPLYRTDLFPDESTAPAPPAVTAPSGAGAGVTDSEVPA